MEKPGGVCGKLFSRKQKVVQKYRGNLAAVTQQVVFVVLSLDNPTGFV